VSFFCLFAVKTQAFKKLKNIRLIFGIGQEAMAQLLGISLSLFKMVEAGKRNLPSAAFPVFPWLAEEAKKLSPIENTEIDSETLDFELELLILKKKKRLLEKEIVKINLKRGQNHRLVQLGPAFNAQFPAAQFPSPSIKMDALVYKARIEIQNAETKPEILLQMELEGVKTKILFLESR